MASLQTSGPWAWTRMGCTTGHRMGLCPRVVTGFFLTAPAGSQQRVTSLGQTCPCPRTVMEVGIQRTQHSRGKNPCLRVPTGLARIATGLTEVTGTLTARIRAPSGPQMVRTGVPPALSGRVMPRRGTARRRSGTPGMAIGRTLRAKAETGAVMPAPHSRGRSRRDQQAVGRAEPANSRSGNIQRACQGRRCRFRRVQWAIPP
mmetsp:Transcript_47946/g.104298  ORF Transcript_47946/g.104298 Transcript_47946/m.104298 type:complete len:203 (-) Transcript_47946:559-1167(-)